MPDARQVLNWAGLLLLIAIVIPFVIYAVPGVVGAEGSYVVLSGSMEPSISTGDVIVVDGVDPASIEERDVITYLRADAETPTTHRVVGITEQGDELAFVTQGDANDEPDASPVPASQVMGQVIFTIPYIGYVIEFVNTPMGFVALVIVPFVLLLLSEMYSMLAGRNSEATEVESGEKTTKSTGSVPAHAVSAAPVKAFATNDPTSTSPNDADPDPSPHRPIDTATATDPNGYTTAPETSGDPDDSDESNVIALTRSDLRLSLGVLSGTAVYAGWVLYNVQAAWSFAVAFGSGVGLVLVGTMYYATRGDDTVDAERGDDREFRDASPSGVSGVNSKARTDGAPEWSAEEAPEAELGVREGTEGTHE